MAERMIAGQVVEMTSAAADRWNSGCPTLRDLRMSKVWVGHPSLDGSGRWITLRRATNDRLEPKLSAMLSDEPVVILRGGE
jgi:hypothetical protein